MHRQVHQVDAARAQRGVHGPEFDIATRYGEVLMCIMVTMMYGSGMPLLYAFASFFCLAIGFFDKRFLLRVCRRPRVRHRVGDARARRRAVGGVRAPSLWHVDAHTLSNAAHHGNGGGRRRGTQTPRCPLRVRAANATDSAFSSLLSSGATLQDMLDIANNASAAAQDAAATEYPPILGEI